MDGNNHVICVQSEWINSWLHIAVRRLVLMFTADVKEALEGYIAQVRYVMMAYLMEIRLLQQKKTSAIVLFLSMKKNELIQIWLKVSNIYYNEIKS